MSERSQRQQPVDAGAALVVMLVLVILCALIITPLLTYNLGLASSRKVSHARVVRTEAVEGGLRVALLDPMGLWTTCAGATMTRSVALPSPAMAISTSNRCFLVGEQRRDAPQDLRYSVVTTKAGSAAPSGTWRTGTTYPGSGSTNLAAWIASSTAEATRDTVWLPNLPFRNVSDRPSRGYAMPSGNCTVYFPGTYKNALTVNNSGGTDVYFASGVYYFEAPVTLRASRPIVLGAGATPGCTDDESAVANAVGAPGIHHISGGGVTFVFGAGGSLTIDDRYGSGNTGSVVFNQRYVASSRALSDSSRGISIMTVNGVQQGATLADLSTSTLNVPASRITGTGDLATSQGYRPSTVGNATLPAIVSIDFVNRRDLSVSIPGYIAAPQGRVVVNASPSTAAVGKTVLLDGGALAGAIEIRGTRPATFRLGTDNPVTIRTIRVEALTSAGSPRMRAAATVKVREDGESGVQSWQVDLAA